MTRSDDHLSHAGQAPDPRDRAIDRIASGEFDGASWSAWSRHAADDVTAWRSIAESLRDQLLLVDAASAAAEIAASVPLPESNAALARIAVFDEDLAADASDDVADGEAPSVARPAPARAGRGAPATDPGRHRALSRARGAAGWMTSALLLVALVVMTPTLDLPADRAPVTIGGGQPGSASPGGETIAASLSAADAFSLYLERGRDEGVVVEERPDRVLVGSRPAAGGDGYEVLYLRQILERAVVPELYVPAGTDEDGRPIMVRLDAAPPPATAPGPM